jgi:nicotinamidase-related amidase
MTIDRVGPDMIGLVPDLMKFVPPAKMFDKHAYSPWTGSALHTQMRDADVDTLVITGGQTDVCVLATMLGAIDWASASFLSRLPCAVPPTRRMMR